MMDYAWRKAIDQMRSAGYAVVIVSPEDLEGADPQRVQERLGDTAYTIVEYYKQKIGRDIDG